MSKASTVVPGTVAATGQQILKEVFGSFTEVQTALLATPDGFVIAAHGVPPNKDGAQMAAMASSMMAMARAVARLSHRPDLALVDGNQAPPLPCPVRCVVGGDALSLSIAAASILAKVVRDRAMTRLDPRWPGYGFARHAGYPTAAHLAALEALGPSPHHRRGFRPVDQAVFRFA